MNKDIQDSINKMRKINSRYDNENYNKDELIVLNNYATRWKVEQPYFSNIDIIEETITDLLKQPEWLQLILHNLVVELFEHNEWDLINEYVEDLDNSDERKQITQFMDRIADRSHTLKSRYELALKILSDHYKK